MLELCKKIENACSTIKPGISCMDFIQYDSKFYFVTGAYDYKFRLYEVEFPLDKQDKDDKDINIKFEYQGNHTIINSCVVNKITFYKDEESESLYLLIISEQNLLLIFTLL